MHKAAKQFDFKYIIATLVAVLLSTSALVSPNQASSGAVVPTSPAEIYICAETNTSTGANPPSPASKAYTLSGSTYTELTKNGTGQYSLSGSIGSVLKINRFPAGSVSGVGTCIDPGATLVKSTANSGAAQYLTLGGTQANATLTIAQGAKVGDVYPFRLGDNATWSSAEFALSVISSPLQASFSNRLIWDCSQRELYSQRVGTTAEDVLGVLQGSIDQYFTIETRNCTGPVSLQSSTLIGTTTKTGSDYFKDANTVATNTSLSSSPTGFYLVATPAVNESSKLIILLSDFSKEINLAPTPYAFNDTGATTTPSKLYVCKDDGSGKGYVSTGPGKTGSVSGIFQSAVLNIKADVGMKLTVVDECVSTGPVGMAYWDFPLRHVSFTPEAQLHTSVFVVKYSDNYQRLEFEIAGSDSYNYPGTVNLRPSSWTGGTFASEFEVLETPAGAPTVSQASSTSATVSWTASTSSSTTSHKVLTYDGNGTLVSGKTCQVNLPTTSCNVTGLSSGLSYTFKVVALSSGGESPASTASSPITLTAGPVAPTSPSQPSVQAGEGSATVSWTAVSGATSYTVTSNPGSRTCTTSTTSCTVSGLATGSYTFTVTATNSAGTSAPSTSSSSVAVTASSNNNTSNSPTSSTPSAPNIDLSSLSGSGSNGSSGPGGALATASAGQTFTLTGTGMNNVNQVNVGNKKAIITLKTATKLGFKLPKNLRAGVYDLSLYGSFGSMTEAKFFSVAKKKVTQIVAGFGGNSPALNEVVNAGISRTLARLGGGVTLVCNGSTSGITVTDAARKLARDRARAACAEAKRSNPSLATKIRISPASAVGAQARNVKLVYRNY